MILTIPIFHPVVHSMGFDPFWFAVVSVIAIEMGLVTPPFGMVVFTMKATLGDSVTVEEIFPRRRALDYYDDHCPDYYMSLSVYLYISSP